MKISNHRYKTLWCFLENDKLFVFRTVQIQRISIGLTRVQNDFIKFFQQVVFFD